jgi:hypothetical protein
MSVLGELGAGAVAIAAGGVTLAIVATVVGSKTTPQAISDLARTEAKIIAAAVNPGGALTHGGGLQAFTTPTFNQ